MEVRRRRRRRGGGKVLGEGEDEDEQWPGTADRPIIPASPTKNIKLYIVYLGGGGGEVQIDAEVAVAR